MPNRPPLIGFAYDAGYARVVETYRALLGSTAFAGCDSAVAAFEPRHAQKFIQELSRQDVTLAHIGMPGKPGYDRQLHDFMDAYAAARHKPVLGLVSHDDEQTRYVLEQWLARKGGDALPRPPGDLITIVETRRPLTADTLEIALQALADKRKALLSELPRRGTTPTPAATVAVESLLLWKDSPLKKMIPLKVPLT